MVDKNNSNKTNQVQKKTVRQQVQNRKVKQWSNIWWKWIVIWIWIFFIVIMLIIFFFFFYLTSHPDVWIQIWMWPSTIKSITSVFAWLLFWSFFVVFLIFWLIYLYKLLTKDVEKVKNGIWTFVIILLWTTNLFFWWIVFSRINNIKIDDVIKTKKVLLWYVQFESKDKPWEIEYTPMWTSNFPLIWPVNISFKLNTNVFNDNYKNNLTRTEWNIQPIKFILDCWNGQFIEYPARYKFSANKYCLYTHKWSYNVKFKFIYNTKTEENKELKLPWKLINIKSEVKFLSNTELHNKNTLVVWGVWDEVKVDFSNIPLDLWLNWNDIEVDFEWKNKFKKIWWISKYTYLDGGKKSIDIKLLNKEWYPYYRIPIRIGDPTKPLCSIKQREYNWKYIFTVSPNLKNINPIKDYNYNIKNISNISTIGKWRWKMIRTILRNGSDYKITWNIIDTVWNVGICSTTVKLSSKKNYKYSIKVYNENKNEIHYKNNEVIVNIIPKTFTLKIWDIIWWKENITDIWFDTNDDGNINEKTNTLELTITKDTKLNTIIKDLYWNTAIKTLNFKVEQKEVIARLKSDTYKWESPLKIKFDASTSEVTNDTDSITYFHRNFGDGGILQNTRRWNLEYTYKKPWEYIMKLTVETEKWYKDTITKKIIVYKPVNTAQIIFPNNLWWQVKAGNSLNIELQTSWNVKNVAWNFWDGKIFSCEWRECTSITHRYKKKWLYKVSVKISYIDGSPSTTANSTINVIE